MLSADLGSFAAALVDAFIAGRRKPVLPVGRRDEYVALLTRLMASEELLSAYCEAIDAERKSRRVDRMLLELRGEEIPDKEVAANGFVNLTDDQLADFALSSSALQAIAEHLYRDPDLQPGEWLTNAVLLDLRVRANSAGETGFPGAEAVSSLMTHHSRKDSRGTCRSPNEGDLS
jgi:hypothetical protein